jgi:hypothetical protein
MALVVRPAFLAGVPVVSNLTLHPEAIGCDPDLYVPLRTWKQIPELRDCVLFLDEIQATFPSRESQKMPAELGRILNQLRKPNVQLTLTAPAWTRADIIIRECVQYVTLAHGAFPDRYVRDPAPKLWPSIAKNVDGKRLRVETNGWLPNRLFRYTTYDATAFDEFTLARAGKLKALSKHWYWRQRHADQALYESTEQVNLLDHLDETGQCWTCGGHRARAKCSCEPGSSGGRPRAPEAASGVASGR